VSKENLPFASVIVDLMLPLLSFKYTATEAKGFPVATVPERVGVVVPPPPPPPQLKATLPKDACQYC
jgi:hypothetical protein